METLSFNNVKEQQHMILEPLQVMINLALLNYCVRTSIELIPLDNNLATLHQHSRLQIWL